MNHVAASKSVSKAEVSVALSATHSVEIDTLGFWYIDELRMLDSNGKVLCFKQGDWLFDLLVADVYKDEKLCDLINEQCLEA